MEVFDPKNPEMMIFEDREDFFDSAREMFQEAIKRYFVSIKVNPVCSLHFLKTSLCDHIHECLDTLEANCEIEIERTEQLGRNTSKIYIRKKD